MDISQAGPPRKDDEGSSDATANICIRDVFSFRDAEKVMYCRLCATVNNDAVSIFGVEGVRMKLAEKINLALPIWVSKNMGPPLHVCRKCIINLQFTIGFINQVIAAQKKINSVFQVLQDISKRNVPTECEKNTSAPPFITYFKAKKTKNLISVIRAPNHSTEKENEAEETLAAISHITESVGNPMESLAKENMLTTEKTAARGEIIIGQETLNRGKMSNTEIDVATQNFATTQKTFTTQKSLLKQKSTGRVAADYKSMLSIPPVVDLSDDSNDNGLGEDDPEDAFIESAEVLEAPEMSNTGDNIRLVGGEPEEITSDPKINLKGSVEVLGNGCNITSTTGVNAGSDSSKPMDSAASNSKRTAEVLGNVCKYCGRKFKWSAELLFHHTSAHPDVVFCCRVCFKVFYDDKEVFSKHVMSHAKHVVEKSVDMSSESAPRSSDVSSEPIVDASLVSQLENQSHVRLNYICKYCSKKYSNLNELFSHQTECHTDVVFRCTQCSKIFYENVEELYKHEEGHGIYRDTSLQSDDKLNADNAGKDGPRGYSGLTEQQQEWVKRILSDVPKKKSAGKSNDTSHPGNKNSLLKPSSTKILPNTANKTDFSTVKTFGSVVHPQVAVELKVSFQDEMTQPQVQKSSFKPSQVVFERVKTYMCKACQIEFKTEEERELHRLFHHRLKVPCRFCPRTLPGKSELLEHEKSHFKKPKLYCRKCEEVFDDFDALKQHRRTECVHIIPRFSCHVCKRLYVRESELKIHLETHLDERPFLCEKCGQCFKDVPSLREHRSTPCKGRGFARGYECDICDRSFQNARLLARHRLDFHRALYPCPLCGLVFRSKPTMTSHMKSHSKITCLICDESFERLDLLQSHRKNEHPEEDMTEFSAFENRGTITIPRLKCDLCDKCFASEMTLKVHKNMHSSEVAWKCRLCDEKFQSRLQLESHMSSHPGERPHQCTVCDQTFTLYESLVQHEKVHFQEESHVCEKCGKSFSSTLDLSKHLAEHTLFKAFTCSFCPMSFSRKISLLIHQRSHITRLYSCSVCSEKFSQLELVREHEKTHGNFRKDSPVASDDMDEDALAASLLDMSENIVGVSADLEEVIASTSSCNDVQMKVGAHSNIILDNGYAEVVYVSHTLDDIL